MTSRRAAFSLGSNLGDRLAHLRGAVAAIEAEPGVAVVAVSAVVETEPVGGPDQPDFLNAVLVVDTTLEPEQLLRLAHRAERAAGRTRDVRWGARTLDVDLLAVGDLVRGSEQLQLPHPRAHTRSFVLTPWAQVDPDFRLPGRGQVRALSDAVGAAGVRATDLSLTAGA